MEWSGMWRIVATAAILMVSGPRVPAADVGPDVSVVTDTKPGAPAVHGAAKIVAALEARGVAVEKAETIEAARGKIIVVTGLATGSGAAGELVKAGRLNVPPAKEGLLVKRMEIGGKAGVLVAGSDDRGVMYGSLDVADRIGWSADSAQPLSEVRDIVEAPYAPERAVSLYTMNRAYFESRFYDSAYWERYLDMLAANRFNTLAVIFGYENGGFLAPPYPYFFDVEEFPGVRIVGITPQQQKRNLDALNRLIGMAHARGISVTLGIWDHIYRGGVQANATPGSERALQEPTPNLVWGVTAENLVPYTKAALAKLFRLAPEVDAIQCRMHDESGLKMSEQVGFWKEVFALMKEHAPKMRFDARAKGLPDEVIEAGIASGIPLRVATKYWMEQMGMPFHPTHINPPDQRNRRHSYADLLRYPQRYKMHWRMWNGGTTRVLVWGDPDYARRFVESTRLYDGDGFEINEPLCTKMQAQAHDLKPFDLLNAKYRYYDYEFERYWHFFQVFGRLGYNPATPAEVWEREFQRRFGAEAGPHVAKALHRASAVLPRIVAACYPYKSFPMTRGWAEKQPLGDLPKYAQAEGSDVAQFASFDEEAENLLAGGETAKVRPAQTSRWFAKVSQEIASEVAAAEKKAADPPGKEFQSTVVDLKILSNLAAFHSRRIPAAVAYRLYIRSGDVAALDVAIAHERLAVEAWRQLVAAAGDVYTDDLAMGNRRAGLCGHWKDELAGLESGLAALERDRGKSQGGASQSATAALKQLAEAMAREAPAPQVRHQSVGELPAGEPLTVTATVRAESGVQWVRLRYRSVNQHLDYETLPMQPTGRADEYQAVVPADKIDPQWDFMYYIEAMDNRGRGRIYPDLEEQTPYVVVKLRR